MIVEVLGHFVIITVSPVHVSRTPYRLDQSWDFCVGRADPEHALRCRVEDDKVLILVGDDHSIAHV